MSGEESAAGSPAQNLHEEEEDEQPRDLGDYDVAAAGDSDKDSDALSEIDEDQFDDYDPTTARLDEKRPEPQVIDEDAARTLKAGRRKGTATKKPKEGRRAKKRTRDDDNDGADGEILHTKRARKATGADAPEQESEPEVEENLSPEERRRRAIERAARNQPKSKGSRRKKKDEVDLEDELDERIADLKLRMENACQADNQAREAGQPALHKLKLLPEVMALLNRNNNQAAVVDPDTNFLQHVKFFLEPLNDGSLPAYNIQRDIFQAMTRLPIEKETLRSSGIGKVVLFYTKSKKPEVGIKRMAERLLGEWSRPILKRTDDYKKRHIETREFDYQAAKMRQVAASSQLTLNQRHTTQSLAEAERARILAPTRDVSRARVTGVPSTYTIAPRSTFDPARSVQEYRPIGAGGIEAFRKIAQKGKKKA
ncbi:hypothetical protein F4677DRAFT_432376 [Hypoxylon crocopeplum]|nr:hypothetical protein F4677DRAFT_432376 [Hypoxylon crocopeplum]